MDRPAFSHFPPILALTLLFCSQPGASAPTDEHYQPKCFWRLSQRVHIVQPQGPVVADIVYLHGLGDRADNHAPLFKQASENGFRILAIDLPSHGLTKGASINFFTFRQLGKMALEVQKRYAVGMRPWFLMGWSTGGLIATRAIQKRMVDKDRTFKGVVLHAPALSVPLLVGEGGRITNRTLTLNPKPPHLAPPSPKGPFYVPLFALNLKMQTLLAQFGKWPREVPLAVFLAGDRDRYVNSQQVQNWVEAQRDEVDDFTLRVYPKAFHELDNEPEPVGSQVRKQSIQWMQARLGRS